MVPHFDKAMTAELAKLYKRKFADKEILDLHGKSLSLILDITRLRRVHEGTSTAVTDELMEVVAESEFGRTMFTEKLQMVGMLKLKAGFDKFATDLGPSTTITVEWKDSTINKLTENALVLNKDTIENLSWDQVVGAFLEIKSSSLCT